MHGADSQTGRCTADDDGNRPEITRTERRVLGAPGGSQSARLGGFLSNLQDATGITKLLSTLHSSHTSPSLRLP